MSSKAPALAISAPHAIVTLSKSSTAHFVTLRRIRKKAVRRAMTPPFSRRKAYHGSNRTVVTRRSGKAIECGHLKRSKHSSRFAPARCDDSARLHLISLRKAPVGLLSDGEEVDVV